MVKFRALLRTRPERDVREAADDRIALAKEASAHDRLLLPSRRVGGRLAGPLGLNGQRHRVASRLHIEPCVRFSRTRLTDIVHRRQTHAWT